jgi:three-Cys-motif partner protein
MPERLEDSDPEKWRSLEHTRMKHRLLSRYLAGYIPILAHTQHRRGQKAQIVLVDGFAGRGRYTGGEGGSPLVIVSVAEEVLEHLGSHAAQTQITCAFIEANSDNHEALVNEINDAKRTIRAGIQLLDPVRGEFATAIAPLIAQAKRMDGLFVFIDPFGYGDIPLTVMRDILRCPRGEVFITLMIEYINRFFEQTDRDGAFMSLFGVSKAELDRVRERLRAAPDREAALRDYYMERLRQSAGARFTWSFRMVPEGQDTTMYYLIHGSTHPRALRLMKTTMKKQGTQGEYAFFGRSDFARRQQLTLIPRDDQEALQDRLVKDYEGQSLAIEALLDDVCDKEAYYYYIDEHINRAARTLRDDGRIDFTPVTSKTARGLQGQDRLSFPSPPRPKKAPPVPLAPTPKPVQRTLF